VMHEWGLTSLPKGPLLLLAAIFCVLRHYVQRIRLCCAVMC
jgi:hypothetical protein